MRTPLTGRPLTSLSAVTLCLLVVAGCSDQDAGSTSSPSASSAASPSSVASSVASSAASSAASSSATSSPSPSDGATASPSVESPALPTASATPTGRAAQTLNDAVSALVASNTGIYRAATIVPGVRIEEQGRYRLSPLAFDVTRVYRPTGSTAASSDPTLAVRAILVGGRLYLRVLSGAVGASKCYLATDEPLGSVAGLDVDAAAPPPAIAGLLAAQGDRQADGNVVGSTDLDSAVGMLGQRAVSAFGVDPTTGVRLPAFFRLRDGRVTSWQLDLGDLARSLRAAGQQVPELARSLRKTGAPIGVFLNVKRLTGKPAGATSGGRISAPDPADVVTPAGDSQQAVQAALATCPAG